MFTGEYRHSIDEKGRLIIPAKVRQGFGEDIVITRGLDGCLFGYDKKSWEKLMDNLNSLPFTKRDVRYFARFFASGASTLEFDKQGRVNLPSYLMKHANLDKDVVILGVSDHIEIWDSNKWDKFMDENIDSLSDIAENLFNSGLDL